MLRRYQQKVTAFCVFLVLTIFGTAPLCADDLTDAKNAYGAGQFEEAASLLRPLVRQQNMEAVYLLARMYEQGDGVEKDLDEAKRLFRIAADSGDEAAQQRLDIFDAQGADDSVVIEWYLPSAEEGDTEAQYNLGFMYETGWGVQVNEANAVRWYHEAAEMQHDVAQLRLGMMYIVGVGGVESLNTGMTLLRQSAENGNRIAEALIQDLFDASDVDIQQSTQIVAGIRRVIDEGEKSTLATLRKSLELVHEKDSPKKKKTVNASRSSNLQKTDKVAKKVDVVKAVTGKSRPEPAAKPTNTKQAKTDASHSKVPNKHSGKPPAFQSETPMSSRNLFSWYLNSANQGEADSQYHLGELYIKGEEVEKDVEEGVRWIKLAAEQEHEMAEIYMQLWSDSASFNAFDSSVSVGWLKTAGRDFDMDAIFNLAFMYEMGRGVPKNFNIAKQWYKFAAVEGHAEAKRRLAQLKKTTANRTMDGAEVGVEIEPNLPVILGLLALLVVGVGGYYLHQKRQAGGVSVPPLEGGVNDVLNKVQKPHGLQAEDRKFFDELWDAPAPVSATAPRSQPTSRAPLNANQASSMDGTGSRESANQARESRQNIGGSDAISTPPSRPEEIKSPEISAVEKKLSDAIDKLIETEEGASNLAGKAKSKASSDKMHSVQSTEKQAVMPASKKPSANVPSEPSEKKTDELSGEFAADAFLSNGISMDELAASRVSADNLFADGVAIDEAGKAIGRGDYDPRRLSAEEMQLDNISSKTSISASAISDSSQKLRPIGAAASLLPKKSTASSDFSQSEISSEDIEAPREEPPVDVNAPMTNNEERSLSEVHFNIGVMFSNGDGVPKNNAQAAKWFLKAAEEGMPEAQFSIGQCYLTGSGVQKNSTLAMEWIQKAADNHYKPAQEELQKKNRAS